MMKVVLKKTMICLLVVSMLLASVGITGVMASSADATEITVGEPVDCVTTETEWFKFTTQTAGLYEISSYGEYDLVGTLYNSSMNMIAYNDDYYFEAGDFNIETELEANSTYYLKVDSYTEKIEFSYTVAVELVPPAESVEIFSDKDWGYVSERVAFYPIMYPENCVYEDCTWSIADESVARIVDGYFDGCFVLFASVGTTELKCTTASGLTATVEIECRPTPEIYYDTPVTVEVGEYNTAYFVFTPEESGLYTVYSEGGMDADVVVMDSSFETVTEDYDGGADMNFSAVAELLAGETYYIGCSAYFNDPYATEYTVNVVKTPAATGVAVVVDGRPVGYVGDCIYLEAEFLPITAQKGECFWFSENESVASVYTYGTSCEVVLNAVGKAEIVVMTSTGHTASIWVECLEIPELSLGESADVTASYETPAYFSFTPDEDGTYVFYSEGSCSTLGALFDSERSEMLKIDMGSGENGNFSLQYDLLAGETYIIGTSLYTSESYEEDVTGEYTLTVSKPVALEKIEIFDYVTSGDAPSRIVLGDAAVLAVRFLPSAALKEELVWDVSEEGIVELMDLSDLLPGCYAVVAEAEGTVTVTVTSESGYTHSITVTVVTDDILLGDVDSSGDVSGKDSNILKQYLTGSYSDINEPNSDINMDGSIDGKDSNILKQILAGTYDPEY